MYIYIYITVKCGRSEINTTKEMSENVVQPGTTFSLISLVVLISDLPHLTVICITFSEIPGESPLQMENRGVILSEMRQSVAHNPFLPPYLLYIYIYIYIIYIC